MGNEGISLTADVGDQMKTKYLKLLSSNDYNDQEIAMLVKRIAKDIRDHLAVNCTAYQDGIVVEHDDVEEVINYLKNILNISLTKIIPELY